MTRKDYIAIAEALRYARGHAKAAPQFTAGAGSVSGVDVSTPVKASLNGVMAAAEYIANVMRRTTIPASTASTSWPWCAGNGSCSRDRGADVQHEHTAAE